MEVNQAGRGLWCLSITPFKGLLGLTGGVAIYPLQSSCDGLDAGPIFSDRLSSGCASTSNQWAIFLQNLGVALPYISIRQTDFLDRKNAESNPASRVAFLLSSDRIVTQGLPILSEKGAIKLPRSR